MLWSTEMNLNQKLYHTVNIYGRTRLTIQPPSTFLSGAQKLTTQSKNMCSSLIMHAIVLYTISRFQYSLYALFFQVIIFQFIEYFVLKVFTDYFIYLFSSFRIRLRRRSTNITDQQLDDHVRRITENNRSLGQRIVQGILKTEGIIVQRQRVAESLIRIDEAGVAIRWCRTIHRRSYQVSGPNALWHIDGNHKLFL